MDLKTIREQLKDAVKNNTLLTAKHDPNGLNTTFKNFRTVLSHEASSSLANLINNEDYTVYQYENTNLKHTPYYMKITPNSGSSFSVAGSGVTAYSQVASSVVDSLIVVSGSNSGWHIFAEDSAEIANKLANGNLIDKGSLT